MQLFRTELTSSPGGWSTTSTPSASGARSGSNMVPAGQEPPDAAQEELNRLRSGERSLQATVAKNPRG